MNTSFSESRKQISSGSAPKTSYFVVGSWNHQLYQFSVSAQPVQHKNESDARKESERLAQIDSTKSFVVLEIKGVCKAVGTEWK